MLNTFFERNIIFVAAFFLSACGIQCEDNNEVKPSPPPSNYKKLLYLTKPDQSVLFAEQANSVLIGKIEGKNTIAIDTNITYQEMDGFGYTLTGGSALLLSKMSKDKRAQLLTELFDTEGNNIGISFLRISMGASDLDEFVFSYNDLPKGKTDFALENFSREQDQKYLLPVLKEILQINPNIKILAVPWSPPVWMKTNGESKGGELKEDCYAVYADYFVKYILEMEADGIDIYALAIQNEPLHPGNNPSMYMSWQQQAKFIKNNLGPSLELANIDSKIFIYDHNADHIDYPLSILDDPEANKYVAGSAFHLYGGSINDLAKVNTAHPDKDIYFTEQWTGANGNFGEDLNWHISNIIIGGARNWCKTILEWNLAADNNLEPHTDGGCAECLGALTIDGNVIHRNVAYYIVAHASKFVRPGSLRVQSTQPEGLENVVFKSQEGQIVVILQNNNEEEVSFNFSFGEMVFNTTLPAKGVATIVI